MVEELAMQQTSETTKWVRIANLSFADQVGRVGDAGGAIALSKKKAFHQYETDAKEGRLEKLYFPLHVNANHWIAGVVDFGRKRIAFGTYLVRPIFAYHKYLTIYQRRFSSSMWKDIWCTSQIHQLSSILD